MNLFWICFNIYQIKSSTIYLNNTFLKNVQKKCRLIWGESAFLGGNFWMNYYRNLWRMTRQLMIKFLNFMKNIACKDREDSCKSSSSNVRTNSWDRRWDIQWNLWRKYWNFLKGWGTPGRISGLTSAWLTNVYGGNSNRFHGGEFEENAIEFLEEYLN